MTKKPLGITIYQGPSELDGKQIVVIANFTSSNVKIGNMLQFWIMRCDINPILATKLGEDKSICGDCKHRDFGSCYVNLAHGPVHIFDAYHRRRYEYYTPEKLSFFKDKFLRLGAYGDPAAVPIEIWDNVCSVSKGYTGYTHQWKNCNTELKKYCMASVDSERELEVAQNMGWRTFRTRTPDSVITSNEFACPVSREAGKKTTCDERGACMGINTNLTKSPTIIVHGAEFKVNKYIAGVKKIRNKKKYKREFIKI